MATFLEDPRLRQRWNQISHNAEAVTENAAAGIWTFQHRYINPCLGVLGDSVESCTAPCFGDREDRARRQRERDRGARRNTGRAEYSFDFYDDWDDDDEILAGGGSGSGGIFGNWGGTTARGEDWDRLLAGTGAGSRSRHGQGQSEVTDQPKRKRGMSYGTRGVRRKNTEEEDPTIIPSTAPLGFLERLPWKIGGTLRYKPSAANLQDHPGSAGFAGVDENQPLLESDDEDMHPEVTAQMRNRSGTTGSGATSDSFRSRGDLFPSDGEGDEDAIPLDDEFAMTLDRVDDRSSNRTRSSKGKRPASSRAMSRTFSRTTQSSSRSSLKAKKSSASIQNLEDSVHAIGTPSIEDLQREEEEVQRAEDQEVARKREAAAQLALKRGLMNDNHNGTSMSESKREMVHVEEIPQPDLEEASTEDNTRDREGPVQQEQKTAQLPSAAAEPDDTGSQQEGDDFVPARLPYFR